MFLCVRVGKGYATREKRSSQGRGRTPGLINSSDPEVINIIVGEEESTHCQ